MKIHNVVQGTSEWLRLRAGIPTASQFHRIITPKQRKLSESSVGYMNDLLAERVMGRPLETFTSQWMARGSELEEKAVTFYEFTRDVETERIGFVTNDAGTVGCSPDRFILQHAEGALECKCPSPGVHVAYLLAEEAAGVDKDYFCQLQGQLWVCEKEWVDVLSYHPDFPEACIRVTRDEEFIKQLAALVNAFAMQLAEKAEKLRERGIIKPRETVVDDRFGLFLSDEDIAWAMSPKDV